MFGVEGVFAAGLEGDAEVFAAPSGGVAVGDLGQGLVERFLAAAADERADAQDHASHAVAAMHALQAFVFPDDRFQYFGAAEEAFIGLGCRSLLGDELQQSVLEPTTRRTDCQRFQACP